MQLEAISFFLSPVQTHSLLIFPSGWTKSVVVPTIHTSTKIHRKHRSMTMATNFQSFSLCMINSSSLTLRAILSIDSIALWISNSYRIFLALKSTLKWLSRYVPDGDFKLGFRFVRKSTSSFLGLAISRKRGRILRNINRIHGGILNVKRFSEEDFNYSTCVLLDYDNEYWAQKRKSWLIGLRKSS